MNGPQLKVVKGNEDGNKELKYGKCKTSPKKNPVQYGIHGYISPLISVRVVCKPATGAHEGCATSPYIRVE